MKTDIKLVNELRQMFIDGVTPSRLMQHIEQNHKGHERLHYLIKDYFRDAFGIPLLRNVALEEAYSPNPQHSHFNRDIAPEIVQRTNAWNDASLKGSWLEGFSVKSLSEHTERLKNAHFDNLDRVWNDLNDKEKLSIVQAYALRDYYWEVVKILASMAERLQQKIVELECQLSRKESSYDLPSSSVPPDPVQNNCDADAIANIGG